MSGGGLVGGGPLAIEIMYVILINFFFPKLLFSLLRTLTIVKVITKGSS